MRAMMKVAAVGLALALSATAAWSETATLKSEAKSLVTVKKADSVNALGSNFDHSLKVSGAPEAKAMKDSGANRTLKSSAQDANANTETTLDAHRAGLANRKGSPDKFAGAAAKPGQVQALAAANLANSGLRASSSALKAGGIKEKDQVNKLR
jgi:hypothetical protein